MIDPHDIECFYFDEHTRQYRLITVIKRVNRLKLDYIIQMIQEAWHDEAIKRGLQGHVKSFVKIDHDENKIFPLYGEIRV